MATTAALRGTLHPKFVNHQPGGSTNGNDQGFFQQLDSIRRFYPGIQIEPHVTPLSSSAASITLSWNTVTRHDFAGIGIDPVDLIGRLDLLRIERGLIVERWSSAVLTGQLDIVSPPFRSICRLSWIRWSPEYGKYRFTAITN